MRRGGVERTCWLAMIRKLKPNISGVALRMRHEDLKDLLGD